jgi:hypothetical protein
MKKAADQVLFDDYSTCRSKEKGDFLTELAPGRILDPPVNSNTPSSTLGWENELTARLLIPIKLLEEFDNDPALYVRFKIYFSC